MLSPSGQPSVLGDPDLLADAIASLLDNALKYAGAGARIHIDVTGESGNAAVTVTDNGPGIPPDKQRRIGERFYRLNRGVPGYGLGLATAIAIASLHGAYFELRNAEPKGLSVGLRFSRHDPK